MEGAAGENITKNGGGGALRSDITIRCAKAALLLSSLKSSPTRCFDTAIDDDDDIAEIKKKIGDLKLEVTRERLRNKMIKILSFLELFLLVLLFAVSVFLLMLAFKDGAS